MDETEGIIERVTVSVTGREIARMDALVAAPEFRFRDRADLVWAALVSFLNFKERELAAIRSGRRWR